MSNKGHGDMMHMMHQVEAVSGHYAHTDFHLNPAQESYSKESE